MDAFFAKIQKSNDNQLKEERKQTKLLEDLLKAQQKEFKDTQKERRRLAQKSRSVSELLCITKQISDGEWKLVIYNDEVSPANPLKAGTDRRKPEVYDESFADFGSEVLSNDCVWFVLCVTIKSSTIMHVDAHNHEAHACNGIFIIRSSCQSMRLWKIQCLEV